MSKFCTNCGNQLEDNYNVCPSCGAPSPVVVNNQMPASNNQFNGYYQNNNGQYYQNQQPIQENGINYGWVVLGFFIPLAGWILWGTWSKTKPQTAKAAGIAGCIGFAVGIILNILLYI